MTQPLKPAEEATKSLLALAADRKFGTILADPPWRFTNRTGKIAPEHRRLSRYGTMTFAEIENLPVGSIATPVCHLYLWCPNALLPQGLAVIQAWGFQYKSNIVWHKIRKDGGSDGRGVVSISAMSASCYCLAHAESMLAPLPLAAAR
jgi:N6-adenosine-specific RNA methylase IME4